MDGETRDDRRYEPHEAAALLGMSGANLRRLAPIYERVYGDLPRDARRGRVWPPEAIDHLKRARDAVRSGRSQSVQAALVAERTGEDLAGGAGDDLPAPNTLAEFIAEIRALRHTIEDQNRLIIEQGRRIEALETGEPYSPPAPELSEARESDLSPGPTDTPREDTGGHEATKEPPARPWWRKILGR